MKEAASRCRAILEVLAKGSLRTELLDRHAAGYVVELVGEGHKPFPSLQPIHRSSRYNVDFVLHAAPAGE